MDIVIPQKGDYATSNLASEYIHNNQNGVFGFS